MPQQQQQQRIDGGRRGEKLQFFTSPEEEIIFENEGGDNNTGQYQHQKPQQKKRKQQIEMDNGTGVEMARGTHGEHRKYNQRQHQQRPPSPRSSYSYPHKSIPTTKPHSGSILRSPEEIPRRISESSSQSEDSNSEESVGTPRWILPTLMFCQVSGTLMWFSGRVVLADIAKESDSIDESASGFVISCVNAGFIAGALAFAITSAADRMPPSRLFMRCCVIGAASNLWIAFVGPYSLYLLLVFCFITGFCLAGIYPVGMKVASDWYEHGLGTAMGYLVGCVVMGTGLPYLFTVMPIKWRGVVALTSGMAALGGIIMGNFVPEGPYRKAATKFDPKGVIQLITRNADYRCAVFGYLGHMYEVYIYWGFVEGVWDEYLEKTGTNWSSEALAFLSICIGMLGCIIGGYASEVVGSAVVASVCLISSGTLSVLSPLFYNLPPVVVLMIHLVWGMVVVADTPQLSTLISKSVPPNQRGSALTLSTCLGYATSVGSLQLVSKTGIGFRYIFLPFGPGAILGGLQLKRLLFPYSSEGSTDEDDADNNGSREGAKETIIAQRSIITFDIDASYGGESLCGDFESYLQGPG